jgi:hypothetical protein
LIILSLLLPEYEPAGRDIQGKPYSARLFNMI